VPYPIQSGSITDRLRKFFRIRGRTGFQLDEMVAPVVLVQDLTKGPYQAGVTPAAGELIWVANAGGNTGVALILNDKPGSVTEFLDRQFDNRSFSVTWIELQNTTEPGTIEVITDLSLSVAPRANVFGGLPTSSSKLFGIQENDGSATVPVELFSFDAGIVGGSIIWRGLLGGNINTLGVHRTIDPEPNITIGPNDALLLRFTGSVAADQNINLAIRGFYQEQPA